MYTDPTLDVYRALGMTRQTHDGGEEDEKGDYVTMGAAKGTWKVVKRATKMPLGRPGCVLFQISMTSLSLTLRIGPSRNSAGNSYSRLPRNVHTPTE